MRPYDIAWLEEPLDPPDDYDVLARIRRTAGIPIAAGENLGNYNDVRWITDAGAVDIVQPSLAKMGGITQLWKAVAYAGSRGVRAVPHAPFVGPALIAAIHVIAALPHEVLCEHRYCDLEALPIGDGVVQRDGQLRVPKAPGLGFDVDQSILDKYRVR
jgi:L-alanine-DL-glutamate epimerase-like enolase superfamily enzyme